MTPQDITRVLALTRLGPTACKAMHLYFGPNEIKQINVAKFLGVSRSAISQWIQVFNLALIEARYRGNDWSHVSEWMPTEQAKQVRKMAEKARRGLE